MNEWAKKQVNALNQGERQKQIEAEARILEEKIKRQEGPLLWEQLRQSLRDNCAAFNLEAQSEILIFEPAASYEARVHVATVASGMLVQFNEHDNAGRYTINRETHRFDVGLDAKGQATLRREGIPVHYEQFSQSLLEELLRPLKNR